jgi:RHS repeat-associated protein
MIEGEQKVGNFSLTFDDLTIPMAGLPITILRTYDSRNKEKGDFGIGWTMALRDIKIEENCVPGEYWMHESSGGILNRRYDLYEKKEHTISITYPDRRVEKFGIEVSPSFQQYAPIQGTTVSFVAKEGTNSKLEALDMSNDCLVINNVNGYGLYTFDVELYNPDHYRLTTQDGTVYIINQSSGVESITDPNGNTVTFTKDGIIHSAGKNITFKRDDQGRITEITDPKGNSIKYEYDHYGDLVKVTDQEGNSTRFTYNSSHDLIDIIDPRGVKVARNEYDDNGRIIAHIDAEGNRIEYDRDLEGKQEIIRDRMGNITVISYDDNGNVLSKTDPMGNTTTYSYDEKGNMLTKTNPLGNTTTYTYDEKGNVTSITDPLGNKTEYTYNAFGQVEIEKDALGHIITKKYDSRGNLIETTDKKGNIYKYSYDNKGNLLTETDAEGNTISYKYDSSGNLVSETDFNGNETTYTYDSNGNQTSKTVTRKVGEKTEVLTTTYVYDNKNRIMKTINPDLSEIIVEYDENGRQSAVVASGGIRIEYEYDIFGNLVKAKYSDGTEESYTYDKEGRKKSETNCDGLTTYFEYDKAGRQIKVIYPDGTSNQTIYYANGKVWKRIDERGNITEYIYDETGRNTKVKDALGNITYYEYDRLGNMTKMTDAKGNTISYSYDVNGMLEKVVYPDGTFIVYDYDKNGNKKSETDQEGKTTIFDYDKNGNLIKVTDALGNITEYEYDSIGNLNIQKDSNGHATKYEYNSMGRMTKRTLPMGMYETFTYDDFGNILTHTSFNGDTIRYEYKDGRLSKKIYPDGSVEEYTYYASGKIKTIKDSRGTTAYEYDARGRLITQVNPDGSKLTYTYDAAGNRTSVGTPSGTTSYTYDALNRLETVTAPDGGITTYTYDAVGNRESVTYLNGVKTVYRYNSLNRLTGLVNQKADGTVISSYEYTLSDSGNRTKVVENTGRTVEYDYDDTYKLISEKITKPDGSIIEISYTYDPVGNRLTKNENGILTEYTYDANNRLITEGNNIYSYDANGNTLSVADATGATITYSYDYNNRLISINTGTQTILYEYDVDGIRTSKTVNGEKISYIVDRNCDYAQVLEERNSKGELIVSYVYGDDLISQNRAGVVSYYIYDGQGCTRALTDLLGEVTDTYSYDAFGILLENTGTTVNDYLYIGEQYDPNAGFYYLRARYMNPNVGRFTTMDVYEGSVFEPKSLHKYLYCNSDGVNNIDLSGYTTMSLNSQMAALTIMGVLSVLSMSFIAMPNVIHWPASVSLPWISRVEIRDESEEIPTSIDFAQTRRDKKYMTYYRGLSSLDYSECLAKKPILSKAARNMESLIAQCFLNILLRQRGYEKFAEDHSRDSTNSPFISLTTDIGTAIRFSSETGIVATIRTDRKVYFNPFNVYGENEYLIPILIWQSEIVNLRQVSFYMI